MGIHVKDRGGAVPPPELEHFELWCVSRGEVDAGKYVYTGDRRLWRRARREWAADHGWPGGEVEMLAGEVVIGDQPFDFAAVGLPHGGGWSRGDGEDGELVCGEHGLKPEDHCLCR